MDKRLIAERFAKARGTYSREARVQQQIAEKMLHLLTEHTPLHFRHIVEFGCGTGSYSRLLHALHPSTLLLNDLCPEMEECVKDVLYSAPVAPNEKTDSNKKTVRFFPCDAETLDFPQETDLITSCSTLQWFNDPEGFFTRCHHFLTNDGVLAFSTFGPENMHEIRSLTRHGLNYLPLEQLTVLLSPYFDLLHTEEETTCLSFPTPLHVLQHLKQTGVTGTEKKMWTRGRLQTFSDDYVGQFGDANGSVKLTYHPIYIIAKKKKLTTTLY